MEDELRHAVPAGADPSAVDPGPDRTVSALRSFLFFPAVRPELFRKALATGADGVCIDLEDAVGPERKDEARSAAADLLERDSRDGSRAPPALVMVRVNPPASPEGARDLEAIARLDAPPDAVVVPKIDDPAEVAGVGDALRDASGPIRLVLLVETARCLAAVEEVARASEHVAGLMLGGHDLAVDLGARPEWEALLYARSRLVHAAALADVGALDMPLLDLSDPDRLRREARGARALGFSGKAAVHPDQVAPIQEVFSPGPEEVAEARRIVRAYEESGGDAALLDGHVVDRPVLEEARRTLERAGEG